MRLVTPAERQAFNRVAAIGVTLPGATLGIKYDGSPVLRVGGCFFAGIAAHHSAEPGSIVVRSEFAEREWLLREAPDTYYVTEYSGRTRSCWHASRTSTTRRCRTC